MIRIVTEKTRPRESLVGKFVLFDGDFIYASLSKAREVVSESDKSLVGRTFDRSVNDEGMTLHSIASDDYEDSTFRKSSVRCICDTLAEVDHVVAASKASKDMFNAAIAKTHELMAAVDGVEVDDPSILATRKHAGMTP